MTQFFDEREVVQIALSRVGKSRHKLYAAEHLVPDVVDCSSYLRWVFAQMEVQLPRWASQQASMCRRITRDQVRAGDLVFMTSRNPKWSIDHVGHIGLAISNDRLVHAASCAHGVVTMSIDRITPAQCGGRLVGYGRLCPNLLTTRLAA
ncbi:MAG: NlpC/P60 family protein [bacterium]|jgi:cell wall-associated NlpC family hydrolase|nr:NlpC/P60 family protein [bacterium]